MSFPTAPKIPCGSCPYRRDVPSGIWSAEEYDKLPAYDGETWQQPMALFMCHQHDGNLCGGWLACHDKPNLLALRINRVDPNAYEYETDIPIFSTGSEARSHGKRDISNPGVKAAKMIAGLTRKQSEK